MLCPQCQSSNRGEFRTEIMIHNGRVDDAIPSLFTFPRAWVCFECGCSTFTLAQNELLDLKGSLHEQRGSLTIKPSASGSSRQGEN
jgi:hypothetical protein